MLVTLFLLLQFQTLPEHGSQWDHLDPRQFELRVFENVTDPKDLAFERHEAVLVLGTMDPLPGLMKLTLGQNTIRARMQLPMSRMELTTVREENGNWRAFATSKFVMDPEDRMGASLLIPKEGGLLLDVQRLPVPEPCFDKSLNCGYIAAFPQPLSRQLLIRNADPASALLHYRSNNQDHILWKRFFRYKGNTVRVSDAMLEGEILYLLIADQWAIGMVNMREFEKPGYDVVLQTAFDFSAIKGQFIMERQSVMYRGLPSGFALDGEGNLHIILNNQGFKFVLSPDEILDRRPKLLTFKAAKGRAEPTKTE